MFLAIVDPQKYYPVADKALFSLVKVAKVCGVSCGCDLGAGPVVCLTARGRPIHRISFHGVIPTDRNHRPVSTGSVRS